MLRAAAASLALLTPVVAQATTAERMLERLSLEERAAQLMICRSISSTDEAGLQEIRHLVEDIGIGGVVLSPGCTADAVTLVDDLQARAAIPVIVATDLGSLLLLGATGSAQLAWRAGEVTAIESRALGVHRIFAPLLDVSVDPANPVIQIRSLGEDPALVARLGVAWIAGLRSHGVLVTDASSIGGLQGITSIAGTLQVLNAGRAPLLMPPDPIASRDAIVAAVRDGSLAQVRLDDACLSILRLKDRLGLLAGAGRPEPDWRTRVATAAHAGVAEEIATRGLTLARDPHGLIPSRSDHRVLVVFVSERDSTASGSTLAADLALVSSSFEVHRLPARAPRSQLAGMRAAVEAAVAGGADIVLALTHGQRGEVPPEFAEIAAAAADRAIVVIFGDPCAVPALPEGATVLLGYAASPHLERAAARVLTGTAAVTGRSPITIEGLCHAGDGLSWLPPGTDLPRVAPAEQGLAPDLGKRIRTLLEDAVERRAFPGAVAVVARRGRMVAEIAVGHQTYADDAAAITAGSLFDLASLTKVCATTPSAMLLIDRGLLTLDTRVSDLLPAFDAEGTGKDAVLVRHLLTHTAGLPPFLKFFADLEGKQEIIAAAAAVPLDTAAGERYRYSDIGMILLMACIEAVTDEPFDVFVTREVFAPLGMTSARFSQSGEPIDAVPTEQDSWRGRLVRGEVHDENAFAMGGVSGHAGLFANARDVTRLGQAFLGAGRGLAAPALVRNFVQRQQVVPDSSRALGWGTFTPGGSGGSKLSPHSFGHTGFTGTSIWCDPALDLSIVLLTNRVHPTRDNSGHARVRRDLADLVIDCLDG